MLFLTALASASLLRLIAGSDQVCTDVYPHLSCGLGYTEESACSSAGCCWDGSVCFAPKINGYKYKELISEDGYQSGSLSLSEPSGLFGPDFNDLSIEITQETMERTHIKIVPTNEDRWEIPESVLPRPGGRYTGKDKMTKTILTAPKDDANSPMEILISRVNKLNLPTADVIFIFSKMLVFQDQYIQFVLGSPSNVKVGGYDVSW